MTFSRLAPGVYLAVDRHGRQWYLGGARGAWQYGSYEPAGKRLVMLGTSRTKQGAMNDIRALAA